MLFLTVDRKRTINDLLSNKISAFKVSQLETITWRHGPHLNGSSRSLSDPKRSFKAISTPKAFQKLFVRERQFTLKRDTMRKYQPWTYRIHYARNDIMHVWSISQTWNTLEIFSFSIVFGKYV